MSLIDKKQRIKGQFLKDVNQHQMEIILDQKLNKCIRFKKPDSGIYSFYLTQWPGHLSISGDCPTYVFSRTDDMWELYQQDRKAENITIDTYYWSRQVVSIDKNSPLHDLDEAALRKACIEHINSSYFESDDVREAVQDEMVDQILDPSSTIDEAYENIASFKSENVDFDDFNFIDLLSAHISKCSDSFMWCLYAISWGIHQYNTSKSGEPNDHP